MDIKAQIKKAVEEITGNEKLMAQFRENPVKAVESVIGVDLPDEALEKIVDGVKAKISIDKASGVLGNLKKLF